jgi:hypothetical protein
MLWKLNFIPIWVLNSQSFKRKVGNKNIYGSEHSSIKNNTLP